MEEVKSFEALLDPDERWAHFAIKDEVTNKLRPHTIEDRYRLVESIKLSKSVPDDLQSQFNIARMLCIYAWLYYPINQIADLKSFSVVEAALRLRFPDEKPNLHRLLKKALNEGVLIDNEFSHITFDPKDPTKYSKTLPDIIPSLRNDLAHGSQTLHPGSIFTLTCCAEIINQIFP